MINTFRIHNNTGDMKSSPVEYFDFLKDCKKVDIHNEIKAGETVIVGGGGMLLGENGIEPWAGKLIEISKASKKSIAWGIGANNHTGFSSHYDILKDFSLVGVRDYEAPFEWVPCVSCMDTLFDKYKDFKGEGISIYTHANFRLQLTNETLDVFPTMDNTEDFESVIQFLSSAETIITNSYHGAYWATLMGKKVVVALPFSNKFFFFKHKPVITTDFKFEDAIKHAKNYPTALEECREANINFAKKVEAIL
jgi:hypothetical protein